MVNSDIQLRVGVVDRRSKWVGRQTHSWYEEKETTGPNSIKIISLLYIVFSAYL